MVNPDQKPHETKTKRAETGRKRLEAAQKNGGMQSKKKFKLIKQSRAVVATCSANALPGTWRGISLGMDSAFHNDTQRKSLEQSCK